LLLVVQEVVDSQAVPALELRAVAQVLPIQAVAEVEVQDLLEESEVAAGLVSS
jgi:hypothetical protein